MERRYRKLLLASYVQDAPQGVYPMQRYTGFACRNRSYIFLKPNSEHTVPAKAITVGRTKDTIERRRKHLSTVIDSNQVTLETSR